MSHCCVAGRADVTAKCSVWTVYAGAAAALPPVARATAAAVTARPSAPSQGAETGVWARCASAASSGYLLVTTRGGWRTDTGRRPGPGVRHAAARYGRGCLRRSRARRRARARRRRARRADAARGADRPSQDLDLRRRLRRRPRRRGARRRPAARRAPRRRDRRRGGHADAGPAAPGTSTRSTGPTTSCPGCRRGARPSAARRQRCSAPSTSRRRRAVAGRPGPSDDVQRRSPAAAARRPLADV